MVLMKSRSELREIVMKILYQVFILKEASVEFDVEKLKKEQLEIENDFVNFYMEFWIIKKRLWKKPINI